jgi:hypothetical protein
MFLMSKQGYKPMSTYIRPSPLQTSPNTNDRLEFGQRGPELLHGPV